jgi:hypothetical protein
MYGTGVPTAQLPSRSVHVGMDNRSSREKSKFELIVKYLSPFLAALSVRGPAPPIV